ncbi:MAG: NUDIX hydrolase [Acholeplasmatales bacterium]|nr:NUDIX hydrolase [Acholeplasmatales bacterium]
MKEIYPIVKDIYYKKGSTSFYVRKAVRAFIFKDNKLCLIHINGKDKFGLRDHYETPGGGVEDDENLELALQREISEETGFVVKNITEIGKISIEYNLINRIDEENFFYCEYDSEHEKALLDYEKELFKELSWFTIDEAIYMYTHMKTINCGTMIHERDLNALLYLINYVKPELKMN